MSTAFEFARNQCAPAETVGLPHRVVGVDEPEVETVPADAPETVVTRLLAASHRLRSVLSDHYAEFGLSDVRHAVLQILREAAPDGCSQSQLAERLGQSESSVCMLVKRMRDAELLFRLRSRFDRRNWMLNLTERGQELLTRVEECHGRRMRELLDGISPSELETLSSLLKRFTDEIEHADLNAHAAPGLAENGGGHGDASADRPNLPAAEVQLPPAA